MSNTKLVAEFDHCPYCGSTRRFAEEVAKEQAEKGAMGEGLKYGLYQIGGPILDPRKVNQMLMETLVPETFALLDACMDCGCIYAVRLERGNIPLGDIIRPLGAKSPPGFIPPPGFTSGRG